MDITYQRNISHCEVSKYVKQITIKSVVNAENSDGLDVVRFVESGWQAVVQRDKYKPGDKVMFVPNDSVLPVELSDEMGITKYLGNSKVSVSFMRGNRSEGLVVDKEVVEAYLDYIMHWDELPEVLLQANKMPRKFIPVEFVHFTEIPLLMNEPDTFKVGEHIYESEKFHGTSVAFGIFKNPETNKYQFYIRSMESVFNEDDNDIYQTIIKDMVKNIILPNDYEFFGEVYGPGVYMHYGLSEKAFIGFNVRHDWAYLDLMEARDMCVNLGIPFVDVHKTTYQGLDWAKGIANLPSEAYNGYREGVVLVSAEDTSKMAKIKSDEYMKKNKNN